MSATQTIELDWAASTVATESERRKPSPHIPIPAPCLALADRLLRDDPEFHHYGHAEVRPHGLNDFLFVTPSSPHGAAEVFNHLRWGGLCLFASPHRRQVAHLSGEYQKHGFAIEQGPTCVREGSRWPIPFLSKKTHGFIARKIELLPPGEVTHRFTYRVQLVHHSDPAEPIVVEKRVPTLQNVIDRLARKHPDYPPSGIKKLAQKFVNRIFPTFLTRESGMLMILQEHLPAPYNKRVPRLIDIEKDERGLVRRLRMSWLRNGGEQLSHLEFARQSADLLRVLHDVPQIIHLDLRLDNFVITPHGVGFVDFGSAVRQNEDLTRNPLLQSLFSDLMRTSQIQQMMEKMTVSGQVTSQIIRSGCHKPDKVADLFYLALQFNSPHANPDLAALIDYQPGSREARELADLTSQILRPRNPANPSFRSARDILRAIERLQQSSHRI